MRGKREEWPSSNPNMLHLHKNPPTMPSIHSPTRAFFEYKDRSLKRGSVPKSKTPAGCYLPRIRGPIPLWRDRSPRAQKLQFAEFSQLALRDPPYCTFLHFCRLRPFRSAPNRQSVDFYRILTLTFRKFTSLHILMRLYGFILID